MKNYNSILQKTAAEMPDVFTSHEFNRRAIQNGFPAIKIKHCGLAKFIRKFATNDERFSKTWTKIPDKKAYKEIKMSDFSTIKTMSMTEDEMIIFLKNKGYKIMKPIQDWIEL